LDSILYKRWCFWKYPNSHNHFKLWKEFFFHNLSLFTLFHIKLLCVFAMLLFSNVICWSTLSFTPCVTQSSNMRFNNLEKSKCITFVVYIFYLKNIYTQMWSSKFFISIVMGMKTPQMILNMHYEHDKLEHIMLKSKSNHTQKLIHM